MSSAIEQVARLTKSELKDVVVDQGYRGHGYTGSTVVHVVKSIPRTATRAFRRMLKRRAAIEPTIGHLKSIDWIEIIYTDQPATKSTPSSPPSVTTSANYCAGFFFALFFRC